MEDLDTEVDDVEEPEKRFSEADVEKLIKRRLARAGRESTSALAEMKSQNEALTEQLAELTERIEGQDNASNDAGKKQERALAKAEALIAELTSSLDESKASGLAAAEKLQDHIKSAAIRKALNKAGVIPNGQAHATKLMMEDLAAQILEEDGKHVVVATVNGRETDDIAAAAAGWLKENPHFASHPGPGTGEKPVGRKSAGLVRPELTPETIATSDPGSLIKSGLEAAFAASS